MPTLTLPVELTISQLDPLRAELQAAIAATGPVTIVATAVERVDAAALQLLSAAALAGAPLQWESPSAVIVKAAERCGLTQTLGLRASPR